MRIVQENKKADVREFECSCCGYYELYKAKEKRKCPMCKHVDPPRANRYMWKTKPVGYSRTFPPDQIKKAMQSVYAARRKGVKLKTQRTFAGLVVTVESLPL